MCGRYYFGEKTKEALVREFGDPGTCVPTGEITPGMDPLVILERGGRPSPGTMHWGMQGFGGGLVINARAEEAEEKPMFSSGIRHRRLVIPAGKFYEWDREHNKVEFDLPGAEIIYLAGLYDLSANREAFVILTTKANASMMPVHDRMPLMIPGKEIGNWLENGERTKDFLQSAMPQLRRRQDYEQLSLFGNVKGI